MTVSHDVNVVSELITSTIHVEIQIGSASEPLCNPMEIPVAPFVVCDLQIRLMRLLVPPSYDARNPVPAPL